MIVDSNLNLKIRHFFLRAGSRHRPGVGDLVNCAVEFSIAVGVDLYVRLVANFHIHDVVLVYVHARFHVIEVGHAHHFRAGKLSRRHDALAEFAV